MLSDSPYADTEQLSSILESHPNCPKFHIAHVNSRSLWKNHDNILTLLNCVTNNKFDVVGITETWLSVNTPTHMISIPNYNFVRTDRRDRHGGGVGFYVRNDIKFTIRNDLNICSDSFESMFIEISDNHRPTLIGVIYRPPSSSSRSFIDDFSNYVLNTILICVSCYVTLTLIY